MEGRTDCWMDGKSCLVGRMDCWMVGWMVG